jgi:alanyl-tRNA synthetase
MNTRELIIDTTNKVLKDFKYPELVIDTNILPNKEDQSTLFMCSGMQRVKNKFSSEIGTYSSVQSCIRLQDIDLVGDDSHISSFEMIGTFGFNTDDYKKHQQIWHMVLHELGIKNKVNHITRHSQMEFEKWSYWQHLGYNTIIDDESCIWSDGQIGGYCCEVFVGDLEIGNLVNPNKVSCDIGFGLERLVQVIENKSINETSLFDLSLSPLARDHKRTLQLMKNQGIYPGAKGVYSVCKRLIRNLIRNNEFLPEFQDWINSEKELLAKKESFIDKNIDKWDTQLESYWHQTHGITKEDLEEWLLKKTNEKKEF